MNSGLPLVGMVSARRLVNEWLRPLSLECDEHPSLLYCEGAKFHHDGISFPDCAFVVVWLCADPRRACDLVFPHIGKRVRLDYGTVVVFDSYQPHGVVKRGRRHFFEADFDLQGHPSLLLSYDLNLADPSVAKAMAVTRWSNHCRKALRSTHFVVPDSFIDTVDEKTGRWTVKSSKASKGAL